MINIYNTSCQCWSTELGGRFPTRLRYRPTDSSKDIDI